MRRTAFLLLTLALLTVPVCAVQLPGELLDALPEEAAELAEGEGITEEGVQLLVQSFFDALRASLDRSLRGAVLLALTVLLTGAADGFASSLGENASRFVPLVGVLCVTTLSAGDLSSLIGLGTARTSGGAGRRAGCRTGRPLHRSDRCAGHRAPAADRPQAGAGRMPR